MTPATIYHHYLRGCIMSKVYTVEFAGSDSTLFIIVTRYCDGINCTRVVTAIGNHCGIIQSKLTDDGIDRDANDIGTRERFVGTLVDSWSAHDPECCVDDGPIVETRAALLAIADVIFGE